MIGLPLTALAVMVKSVQDGNGYILRTNGEIVPFNPTVDFEGEKVYDMDAVRKSCNFDYFEIAYLNDNMILICDEEGLFKSPAIQNTFATKLYQNSHNSNMIGIVGDCVICHTNAVR